MRQPFQNENYAWKLLHLITRDHQRLLKKIIQHFQMVCLVWISDLLCTHPWQWFIWHHLWYIVQPHLNHHIHQCEKSIKNEKSCTGTKWWQIVSIVPYLFEKWMSKYKLNLTISNIWFQEPPFALYKISCLPW